jgi:hypothetical protein
MSEENWWPEFRRYAQALEKINRIPDVVIRNLHATTRLFMILKQQRSDSVSIAPGKIESLAKSTEELLQAMEVLKEHASQEQSKKFYTAIARTIQLGLTELNDSPLKNPMGEVKTVPRSAKSEETTTETALANQLGSRVYELKKQYLPVMAAQHEAKKEKGLKDSAADEADRLEGFLEACEHWLKHLYALEYSKRVLQENIDDTQTPVVKEPLPLQFRLERNKPSYTTRLIKASYQQPTAEDVTILDIINVCFQIPTFDRGGKTLIDDKDVIRFIRLHSKKDDLMNFRSDPLSKLAAEMFEILIQAVNEIKQHAKQTVALINQTPMQDMEYAFSGIIPDECRTLLRLKFNAMLPGMNEDHYRADQKKGPQERSTRTIEAMEEYNRTFGKMKKQQLSTLKSNLAMSYWLRKMLISVIRNNQNLKKKASEKGEPQEKNDKTAVDYSNWMLVGTSQTIGEEDIGNFYINPEDVISSQMSIQRVDRTDKWIAVRKSEKMHRIRKNDFFIVIRKFIENDLNPALERYKLRVIDLQNQLLPEIHERLEDSHRIDLIRSAILGTVITNLEEFFEATAFHKTLRRYFQKPGYDNIHYPAHEKLRQLASGVALSNTSILQMKYRRVLKVKSEILRELDRINSALKADGLLETGKAELTKRQQLLHNLQKIIKKVLDILNFAKPTLKDVRLEPEEEYVAVGD